MMTDEESMDLEHRYAKSDEPRGFPSVAQVISIWKEKFAEGTLNESHFKEHWRLYVPQVLSLDPTVPSCDRALDENHPIFSIIEEFICDGDPKEVFERIQRLDEPSTICGKVFKMSEPTYHCRECGTDPTCVLCVECFKKSAHKNHKYKMSMSNGGGCCDCGDTEAWKCHPYCSIHIVGTLPGISENENQFPEDMAKRARIIFSAVLNYAYHLLTYDHSPDLPADLRLKVAEEDPMSFLESTDTYCTVLYNDETHTFDHVITTLSKVIKCNQRDAMDYVTNIDREGRAVVKCSSFQFCTELKSEVERITSRTTSKPLKVQVKHSHVISHQFYAIKLLARIQKILSYSKHFRQIFSEIVLQWKPPPETNILEGIFLSDSSLWKSARVHWHRLFISGMLKEYEHKKAFAKIFTKNYGSIMKDFIRDDHDHSFSVAALAVQIFTVPTIAHYLIAYQDVLFVLLNTFLSECNSNQKDGKLEFQRNEQYSAMMFRRAQYIVYDLHYLINTIPEAWTEELRKGFFQGLCLFLRLLCLMQGMDAVTRQIGQHMEYEPEWETAFNLHIKLSPVITSMIKWCGTDKNMLIKAYRATLKKLYENPCPDLNTPGEVRELADHSTTCIIYDVSSQPVSIHLPLSRFLAGLHVQLEKFGLNFYSSEFQFTSKQTPEQIIEPVLRTQVMIAQVHSNLWRRNGYSILHQIYFYHNVKCRNEMLNKDIIMLQIGASLIESNDFLIHLLNKFNLINWADPDFEETAPKKSEEDSIRQTITLVEEFLTLLVTVISERYVVGIGQVSEKDCVKKEIIQQLCIKPLSHSELSKVLPDVGYHDVTIDSIIEEIATFEKPTTGNGKGFYKLKPEFYDQYNVFYYHYTREELSKSEEAQRRRRHEEGLLDCCPPPALPPLTESFSLLVNLLQCDVMFYLIQLVLKRACNLKARSFSESQLHRVLHLIGYALHEEESRHCEYFMFTERCEKWELLRYLEELHGSTRVEAYRDLIKWTINKFKHVSYLTMRNKASKNEDEERMELDQEEKKMSEMSWESSSKHAQKKEKERIAKLAAERRMKIMAQMSSAQESFIKEHAQLYEEATKMDTACVNETMSWETTKTVDFPIALGPNQTHHVSQNPTYVCILCQERQIIRTDAPAMVYGAFVQKSTVLLNDKISNDVEQDDDVYYLTSTMIPSPFTSICGHVMHSTCWEKYFNNISTKENRRPYRLRQPISFDVEKNEFLCPLCESLNNSVLPVLPPLKNIATPKPVFNEQFQFESWLKSIIVAPEKKKKEIEFKKMMEKKSTQARDWLKKPSSSPTSKTALPTSSSAEQVPTEPASSDSDWEEDMREVMFPLPSAIGQSPQSETIVHENDQMEVLLYSTQPSDPAPTPNISDSLMIMIQKYCLSVCIKGQALSAEVEHNSAMYCWKSCSYTIHVVEMLLRSENRSLLGYLPTRQKKCIKALIRISALQEICKNQRLINSNAVTLLGVVFDKSYMYKNTCILDWDPFGMLVSLVMSLPSLFFLSTPSPLPSGSILDLYTTKLMLIATIAQILISVRLPNESEDNKDDDTECLKSYLRILDRNSQVNTTLIWKRITELSLPFLRCCCLFFRFLTNVPAPQCLTEVGGDTYDNMCKFLGLPSTCKELLDNEVVLDVFKNWTEMWKAKQAATPYKLSLEWYFKPRGLITLPDDYSELINSVSMFTCPNSDREDSRNPTICLVCGTILCSQSYCCQKELNGSMIGACAFHASKCGAGAGIFLRMRECEILLLSCLNRGCFLTPPYVDEYGETDQGLRRGNPLKLCTKRYKRLENIWLSHSIHEEVSRSLESTHTLAVTQWQHL